MDAWHHEEATMGVKMLIAKQDDGISEASGRIGLNND